MPSKATKTLMHRSLERLGHPDTFCSIASKTSRGSTNNLDSSSQTKITGKTKSKRRPILTMTNQALESGRMPTQMMKQPMKFKCVSLRACKNSSWTIQLMIISTVRYPRETSNNRSNLLRKMTR